MQVDTQPRLPGISGRRHRDMIAGVEHEGAENPADRLREASARILGCGSRIGKAAAPGRSPPQGVRGEAMNKEDGERGRYRDEYQE